MKIFTLKTGFYLACLLLVCSANIHAQTITASVTTQPCNNNGVISVTVTGLTPPLNYTYTNWTANQFIVNSGVNSTNNSATGLGGYQSPWVNANIWSVSASDGVATVFTTVTLTPTFTFIVVDSVGVCPGPNTLHAVGISGGTSPYSFLWTNLNTSQTYTANPAHVANGPYSLVITDGAGCMVSTPTGSGNINVYSTSNILVNIAGTSANCTNGTATVSVSGGTSPYTFLWSNNATSQSLSGLSQGLLSCVVTDNTGCQSIGYYSMSQAVTINYNNTITNATCLQSNGAVTSFVNGGTSPYTYQWSNGATTANLSGLTGGPYLVQIMDANGCTATGYAYVSATTPVSVTYTATASSCPAPTGSATLTAAGGASPYSIIWYTSPSNSTLTSISGKPSGSYSFKVTDANGCIQTGAAFIPPGSTINASIGGGNVICPATTGGLTISASGSNPPFTYAWSNAATTSAITGVPLGFYSCVITDAAGCSVTKSDAVYQISPVIIGLSSTPATCLYSSNGAVTANATGGTSPYTYSWSNSQTGPTAANLAPGYYYVTAIDASGCVRTNQAYVGNSATSNACYCTITGTVYVDANNNCVRNSGETGVQNIQIHCSGIGYAYTNANGVYSFQVPSGTYTITESVQQTYPLASCQINNQVVTVTASANCVTTVDFANNVNVISDLHIITANWNMPVPGNTYTQKVIIQNEGTVTESTVKLGYKHDGQLSFSSCIPWALIQQNATTYSTWYSITSGFTPLSPNSSSSTFINYNVPTNIPLNTLINCYDTVASAAPISTSWLTDNTPWNNVNNHQATVIGSYDPNFKEVTPKGTGPQGDIYNTDSLFTYVIHFQNTGSYFAQNIVVVDSIDTDLRWTTLRPGYSDHQYTAAMSEDGVMKFSFKNINLPWKSAYGDMLSSGMITYSIKTKKNLPLGTKIKNTAAIYFDYNEPIITNTTINTIAKPGTPSAISELSLIGPGEMLLFPNPANSYFTLVINSTQNTRATLAVSDICGREVSVKDIALRAGENSLTEDTGHLQSGVYIVQLKTTDKMIGKKLIIAK